jgi:hypothetical protein
MPCSLVKHCVEISSSIDNAQKAVSKPWGPHLQGTNTCHTQSVAQKQKKLSEEGTPYTGWGGNH